MEREEWGSVGGGGEDPALVFVAVGGADHDLHGHLRLDGRNDDWRGCLRSGAIDGAIGMGRDMVPESLAFLPSAMASGAIRRKDAVKAISVVFIRNRVGFLP